MRYGDMLGAARDDVQHGGGTGGVHTQGTGGVPAVRRSSGGHRCGERASHPMTVAVPQSNHKYSYIMCFHHLVTLVS
jgi:hypothetical protein